MCEVRGTELSYTGYFLMILKTPDAQRHLTSDALNSLKNDRGEALIFKLVWHQDLSELKYEQTVTFVMS